MVQIFLLASPESASGPVSYSLSAYIPFIIGMIICALVSFLFSGLEAGFLSLTPNWLNEQSAKGNPRIKYISGVLSVPSRMMAVFLTLQTSANVVLTVIWTTVAQMAIVSLNLAGWTIIIAEFILLLGLIIFLELLPKVIFTAYSETTSLFFASPTYTIMRILHPVVWIMEIPAKIILWLRTGKMENPREASFTEEELKTMVEVGETEGVIEEQELEMIHSLFEFGDLVAREIMVPRVDMVALDIDDSVASALDAIIESGHSRVPVYDGSPDKIKGILYAKDLLRDIEKNNLKKQTLKELMRTDILFVPETRDLTSLLEEMQSRKAHMAIVLDEYGGTEGLVSIEDILEEIVGEIEDEYDEPGEEAVTESPDGTYIIDARLGLHDFDDELGFTLPEDEGVETVGGLLYQAAGRIPQEGETIVLDAVEPEPSEEYSNGTGRHVKIYFKILEVSENRIGRVQVRIEKEEIEELRGTSGAVHSDANGVTE